MNISELDLRVLGIAALPLSKTNKVVWEALDNVINAFIAARAEGRTTIVIELESIEAKFSETLFTMGIDL